MRIRFDRGTLVLEPEGAEDPALVPGTEWDGEQHAWRMPACCYAALGPELVERGLAVSRDEISPVSLAGPWNLPPQRWYQEVALARWLAAGRRGVLALPTGSGKTVVAAAAIAHLSVATLCLVPTRVLLDQWVRVLGTAWSHPVGRLGDGERHIAPITVATYTSAAAWASRIGDRFGLVVVDEAHHVGAWCPREVLEMLVAPARLGLTATPPAAGGALATFVGPVVYSLAVDDLAGDALAAYELIPVPIALTGGERGRYRDLRRKFASAYAQAVRGSPEMTWSEFVRHASRSAAGREALEAWRGYRALLAYPAAKRAALRDILARHAESRTLIFTGDNATTYAIARELLIPPITHEIGRGERERVLEQFRTGDVTALVSSQVLDEGLDVPDADVAIIVGGTASVRRHVQRIGRVLRPRAGKRALVYELVVEETTEVDYAKRRHADAARHSRPHDDPDDVGRTPGVVLDDAGAGRDDEEAPPARPPLPSGPVGSSRRWSAVVAAVRARRSERMGGRP